MASTGNVSAKLFHIERHDVCRLDIDYIYINISLSLELETCPSSYTAINYFAWQSRRERLWAAAWRRQLVSSQFLYANCEHVWACTATHTDTQVLHAHSYCIDKHKRPFIGGIPTVDWWYLWPISRLKGFGRLASYNASHNLIYIERMERKKQSSTFVLLW